MESNPLPDYLIGIKPVKPEESLYAVLFSTALQHKLTDDQRQQLKSALTFYYSACNDAHADQKQILQAKQSLVDYLRLAYCVFNDSQMLQDLCKQDVACEFWKAEEYGQFLKARWPPSK